MMIRNLFSRKWPKVESPIRTHKTQTHWKSFWMLQNINCEQKESEWLWFWLFSPTVLFLCSGRKMRSGRPVDVLHIEIVYMLPFSRCMSTSLDVCSGTCMSVRRTCLRVWLSNARVRVDCNQNWWNIDRICCVQTKKNHLNEKCAFVSSFSSCTNIDLIFNIYIDLLVPTQCLFWLFPIPKITYVSFAASFSFSQTFSSIK